MDKARFWATKSPLPEYHAIVFDHPAMEQSFRLVANQFAAVTLGGYVHTPAPMQIQPPESRSDNAPRLSLNFPRQVVGREFKRQLAIIRADAALAREPITVTYAVYLGDTAAPQVTWSLYVGDAAGITFTPEQVSVIATESNPMLQSAGLIYDPAVFTGLELL